MFNKYLRVVVVVVVVNILFRTRVPALAGERPQILPIARLKPHNGSETLPVLDFRDQTFGQTLHGSLLTPMWQGRRVFLEM